MNRVGFYLAPHLPVERVLPPIARKVRGTGARLLVVADDLDLRARIDKALWAHAPERFLAHGDVEEPHAERQPILLSGTCEPVNGATMIALADGKWRPEAEAFERGFLFFDDEGRPAARTAWTLFDERPEIAREFHELENGEWVQRR